MKKIKITLFAVLLSLTGMAAADEPRGPFTYETTVHKMRLPQNMNGTISLRECDDCEYITLRVTSSTQYVFDKKRMRLADFRILVENLRANGDQTMNVTRGDQSNTVIRVFAYTD
ncbi:MAG: hypothetical protein K0U72_16725 [Gammaproteobacteria bacterium]|nr:hypothetical protein [Gammaproteobacteria bacterium]